MRGALTLAFVLLGLGAAAVVLARFAEQEANSLTMARAGYLSALAGAAAIAATTALANVRTSAGPILRSTRRRLLGFSILITFVVLKGWLPDLNRTSEWAGEWIIVEGSMPASAAAAVRAAFSLQAPGLQPILWPLGIAGLALVVAGSIRWTACLAIVPLGWLLLTAFGEPTFAWWFAGVAGLVWLIGSTMTCPRCGALLRYHRISQQFLGSVSFTSWEPRSTPISATISDSAGRPVGRVEGSGTEYIPVERTQSAYRNTYRCKCCAYTASHEVTQEE
ncbi:MAG: hypothetical protein U0625_12630 [Phycisphaerales bacterium]